MRSFVRFERLDRRDLRMPPKSPQYRCCFHRNWDERSGLASCTEIGCPLIDYGTECPALALTRAISEAVTVPLTLMSVRKLALVTAAPDWPLVCATSDALTALFPLVSPISMFMLTGVSGRT